MAGEPNPVRFSGEAGDLEFFEGDFTQEDMLSPEKKAQNEKHAASLKKARAAAAIDDE